MNNLSIDYEKVSLSFNRKNLLKKLVIGTAVVLTLSPLFLKDRLNNNAKLILGFSGFIFSLACCKLPSTEYEEKLIKTYKETGLKQYKTTLQGEILKHQTSLEIHNQQQLAQTIENLPEDYQIDYFAQKYGVSPLISKYYIDENSEDEYQPEAIDNTVTIPPSIFETTIERAESESNTQLAWLKKAIYSSCFLAGKKRSGKTYLMKWLLHAYIENCRKHDVFYISDPHYDDVDFDDVWVSQEIDKKLISNGRLVKKDVQTLRMIDDILNAIKVRKEQGLTTKKGVGLIRVFMDEIDSYSEEIQQEISNFIKVIEYEAAKFGVSVVIGAHSLKKGEMALDSSVTSSMLNILFPSVVLDRNTVLSGAFPSLPRLKTMLDRYKADMPSDGRLVVIQDDSEVFVSHVPKLSLASVAIADQASQTTQTAQTAQPNQARTQAEVSNNPVLEIKKWCDLCYQKYQIYPHRELIKKAWLDITGKELSENGLQLLIDKLASVGICIE